MRDNNEKPPEGGPLLFAFATVFIVIVATRIEPTTFCSDRPKTG